MKEVVVFVKTKKTIEKKNKKWKEEKKNVR